MESLISDLKSRYKDNLMIVASSVNENATYKNAADVFIQMDETVDNWVSICEKYSVNLFFCRDRLDIVDNEVLKRLRETGVDVVIDKNRLIDNKAEFYRLIEDTCKFDKFPDIVIPYYATFEDCNSKEDVMHKLFKITTGIMAEGVKPTFKFTTGEGGLSYREVEMAHSVTYDNLTSPSSRIIEYADLLTLFENMSLAQAKEFMFMEKLAGPEISLDCYVSKSAGFLAYGREKIGRHQKIVDCQSTNNEDYIQMRKLAEEVAKQFNLKNPFNIQFMRNEKNRSLAILEVNNRLSGGCYMLTPLGINMCDIVIKDRTSGMLSDADIKFNTGNAEATVARTEKPVVV